LDILQTQILEILGRIFLTENLQKQIFRYASVAAAPLLIKANGSLDSPRCGERRKSREFTQAQLHNVNKKYRSHIPWCHDLSWYHIALTRPKAIYGNHVLTVYDSKRWPLLLLLL
jgi:hypothetical protein